MSFHNNYIFTVPKNRTKPSMVTVDTGTNIEILCLSSTINVKWIFREGPFPDNAFASSPVNGSNKHQLLILLGNASNEGTYICHGKDSDFDEYLIFSSTTTVNITKGDNFCF